MRFIINFPSIAFLVTFVYDLFPLSLKSSPFLLFFYLLVAKPTQISTAKEGFFCVS